MPLIMHMAQLLQYYSRSAAYHVVGAPLRSKFHFSTSQSRARAFFAAFVLEGGVDQEYEGERVAGFTVELDTQEDTTQEFIVGEHKRPDHFLSFLLDYHLARGRRYLVTVTECECSENSGLCDCFLLPSHDDLVRIRQSVSFFDSSFLDF